MSKKFILFIPTYNCERQISRVLKQLTEGIQKKLSLIYIVDNRSVDDTLGSALITAKEIIKYCPFIITKNDHNYNLGGSHKVALNYAIEHSYDYLIVLHGDDQANIRDLENFIDEKLDPHCDALLGSRFSKDSRLFGYSKFRIFGNLAFNFLFSIVTKFKIEDLGSGLNLYRIEKFKDRFYKSLPDDLTFNYILLMYSIYHNWNMVFFPISWREYDQISNVKILKQTFTIFDILISTYLNSKKINNINYSNRSTYSSSIVYSSLKCLK